MHDLARLDWNVEVITGTFAEVVLYDSTLSSRMTKKPDGSSVSLINSRGEVPNGDGVAGAKFSNPFTTVSTIVTVLPLPIKLEVFSLTIEYCIGATPGALDCIGMYTVSATMMGGQLSVLGVGVMH